MVVQERLEILGGGDGKDSYSYAKYVVVITNIITVIRMNGF
jgi:hypothetical protein